jgi:2-methylcitrate dehydratase PrpD
MAHDPERLALAAKVECVADAECDAIFPSHLPAILTAHLRDGRVVVEKVLTNRGGPENPLSVDELSLKFTLNAARSIGRTDAQRLADDIRRLPEGGSARELMSAVDRALREARSSDGD